MLEETGYTSENFIETGFVSPNSATHNNFTRCFLATEAEPTANRMLDLTEQIGVVLMPLNKVISLIGSEDFLQALQVSSLFLALKHLGLFQNISGGLK